MARGRCKKPCVGCGKLPSVDFQGNDHWTTDKPLCQACREALRDYKKCKALAQKRLKGDLKPVAIPYIGDRCWPHNDYGENFNDPKPFREAFLKLCHVLGIACPQRPEETLVIGQEYLYDQENYLAFEPETVLALRELFSAVQKLSERAYQEGRNRGASMLHNLIEGSTTAQEINEICSRENKG